MEMLPSPPRQTRLIFSLVCQKLIMPALLALTVVVMQAHASSEGPWWTTTSSALVEQLTVKADKEGKGSFVLRIDPGDSSDTFRVSISNPELTKIKGTGESIKITEKVSQMLGSISPAYIVSKDGEILSVEGIDETLRKALEVVDDPEFTAAMEKLFRNPQVAQLMRQKAAENWAIWTSPLLALQLDEGKSYKREYERSMLGINVPTELILTNLGPGKAPGSITLGMVTRSQGEAFREVAHKMAQLMAQKSGMSLDDFIGPKPSNAMKQTTVVLEANPRTGRPYNASMKEEFAVEYEGGEKKSQINRKEFVFVWQ